MRYAGNLNGSAGLRCAEFAYDREFNYCERESLVWQSDS